MENQGKTCPSAKFTKGALLIGIRNEADEIDLLKDPIKITEDVYQKFTQAKTKPEKTLRLANKCIESGCNQWTGKKCGVIDNLLNTVEEKYVKDQLPECGIRSTCRWYSQTGAEACKVCTLVTTFKEDPKEDKFFSGRDTW